MLNFKGVTVISAQVWDLLLFGNTSREGNVNYPLFYNQKWLDLTFLVYQDDANSN